jgi:uncharacterized YigZ family protein
MVEEYNTITTNVQCEIVEKKSKFICSIFKVTCEEEAIDIIESTKKKYNNARHNCFAYIVGIDKVIERYSDDGEPSGTAGMPILEVLRGNGLTNVVAIVTRYFGGILLGTGGLVRAYGGSVKECISQEIICTKKLYEEVVIQTDYNYLGKLENEVHKRKQIIKDILYTDKIEMIVQLKSNVSEEIKKKIIEITNGEAILSSYGFIYI